MANANTLNPGNEPEFYIQQDQLPDICIMDIKLSPDGNYLAITGSNALTYIYRRNPPTQHDGFYKLNWSCQHSRLAKSVVNFIGFDEDNIHQKHIICPVSESMIYQYEIQDDDRIVFRSSYDISHVGYHCIHWLICFTSINVATYELQVYIFIIGSHPIDDNQILSPMADYYTSISFKLADYDKIFKIRLDVKYYKNTNSKLPTKHIFLNKNEKRIYICNYNLNNPEKKYSRNVYCLRINKHYTSHDESIDFKYPDDYLYFKDRNNCTQIMNYFTHSGIQYINKPMTKTHSGYEISKIKTLNDNYIIHEENNTENMLSWGDSGYNYTHIKTYKYCGPTVLVNLFTLENAYKNYIVTHEKDKSTKTFRLGFILFISSETEKKELQTERLFDTVCTGLVTQSNATCAMGLEFSVSGTISDNQNIPIELVDIIKYYL